MVSCDALGVISLKNKLIMSTNGCVISINKASYS